MIDSAYQTLQTIVNKEQDGYVTPSEFNHLAKQVQEDIFRSYVEDLNRDQNKENRGFSNLGVANLVDMQTQRLEPFIVTPGAIAQAGGSYPLPSDLYMLPEDAIRTDAGKIIEKIPSYKKNYMALSGAAPSALFPVGYIEGADLTVLPSTYTDPVTITYIKRPSDPQWAYTALPNGDPAYNESNSTDFELHISEFPNIVVKMLAYFGITMREGEVIQVAESLKQQRTVREES